MSYEFFEYNFLCNVARAQVAQASCTVDWLAKGIRLTFWREMADRVWTNGAEAAPKLNRGLHNADGGPAVNAREPRAISSRRCRGQSLAIGSVDLLGFNFGQLFKGLRHALHPIGMVLLDQGLVGLFNFLDRSRLGNAENANPILIVLERVGCRKEILSGSNIGFVNRLSRPDIGEIRKYAELKAVLPAQTITSDIINQRRGEG